MRNNGQLTDQQILQAFANVRLRKSGGDNALHKPLLLLLMLGKYWNNAARLQLFSDIRRPLENLVRSFSNAEMHHDAAMYPFWYMKNDSAVWSVAGEKSVGKWVMNRGKRDRPNTEYAMNSILQGGIAPGIYQRIINDKVMILEIIFSLMDKHIQIDCRPQLLQYIGIPSFAKPSPFEQTVIKAYNYSCSVCDLNGRQNENNIDIQVAYIRPVEEEGPVDDISNSIAMCEKHKHLFEYGALGIETSGIIRVSKLFREYGGSRALLSLDKKKATLPKIVAHRPAEKLLEWHHAEKYMLFHSGNN